MAEFHATRMGHIFYQSTMPRIAESMERIAAALEKIAERNSGPDNLLMEGENSDSANETDSMDTEMREG